MGHKVDAIKKIKWQNNIESRIGTQSGCKLKSIKIIIISLRLEWGHKVDAIKK